MTLRATLSALTLTTALALSLTACSTIGSGPDTAATQPDENLPVVRVGDRERDATSMPEKSAPMITKNNVTESSSTQTVAAEQVARERVAVQPAVQAQRVTPTPVVSPSTPVGYRQTVVGRKIQQLVNDQNRIDEFSRYYGQQIDALQAQSEKNATAYYSLVAAINSRLQRGTTPGNPILIEQSQRAQTHLEALARDVADLTELANQVATNASVASYLLEAVRASYGLTGAVEEDHERLTKLEDRVNELVVRVDRQMNEISSDLNRRASYLAAERRNMQTLSLAINNGELYGQSLANRAFFSPASALPGEQITATPAGASQANFDRTRPLVVVRFDRPQVEYEQALYLAVSQALERYPSVSFEVVAVAPTGLSPARMSLSATDARTGAEAVFRTMSSMGVPGNRLTMSASRSPQAQTPEVHVFLR